MRLLLIVVFVAYIAGSAFFAYSFTIGPNYRNISVDTTVNITNAPPSVLSVVIESGATNITLNAGTYRNVTCNATIRDYNGGSTITNVSATFFHTTVTFAAADDNNSHYTHTGCTLGAFDTFTRNITCNFLVQYHANASFWTCNVTATDPFNFANASRAWSNTNTTFIDALLALNVTPLIDYGNLAVGDVSTPQQANVTNLGNQNINVSVRGYGNVSTDNLAMYCDIGNISIEYENYNLIGGTDLTVYTNLTNTSVLINNLTILHQTNDSQRVINTTYWTLEIPNTAFGRCNGTVVFQAESSV